LKLSSKEKLMCLENGNFFRSKKKKFIVSSEIFRKILKNLFNVLLFRVINRIDNA